MKTAIIIGANGLTGSLLTKFLLKENYYTEIKLLLRKPIDIDDSRINQIIVDFESVNNNYIKADDVYCCIGTTIKKAKTKEIFRKVDYEYPLKIAQAAYNNGANNFSVITSIGANKRSLFFYSRVKGELEEALKEIPFRSLLIFRPSMIIGKREEYRLGEELGKVIMKYIGFLLPSKIKAVSALSIAKCMYYETISAEVGVKIFESNYIRNNKKSG